MILLLFILVVYGVTQIVVESVIFKPIRLIAQAIHPILGTLMSCFLCISVWVSVIYSIFFISVTLCYEFITYNTTIYNNTTLLVYTLKCVFTDAMIGSAGAWLLHCLEIFLSYGRKRENI